MYSQTTIAGNLGKDPVSRKTNAGDPVTNLSVATSRSWNNEQGERQERTTWFQVSVWGRLAEVCQQYLKKGSKVLVVGEMQQPNIWHDSNGNARANLELRAATVKFMSPSGQAQQMRQGEAEPSNDPMGGMQYEENDVPF